MAERRPLTAGLKQAEEIDPVLEKQFVHGEKGAERQAGEGSDRFVGDGRTRDQESVRGKPSTTDHPHPRRFRCRPQKGILGAAAQGPVPERHARNP